MQSAEMDVVPLLCLNGPCVNATVDAPAGVQAGAATALPWTAIDGKPRYAVYVVVEHRDALSLMYLKSYAKPYQAQQRVEQITAICMTPSQT